VKREDGERGSSRWLTVRLTAALGGLVAAEALPETRKTTATERRRRRRFLASSASRLRLEGVVDVAEDGGHGRDVEAAGGAQSPRCCQTAAAAALGCEDREEGRESAWAREKGE
jgi:hypothetical protein